LYATSSMLTAFTQITFELSKTMLSIFLHGLVLWSSPPAMRYPPSRTCAVIMIRFTHVISTGDAGLQCGLQEHNFYNGASEMEEYSVAHVMYTACPAVTVPALFVWWGLSHLKWHGKFSMINPLLERPFANPYTYSVGFICAWSSIAAISNMEWETDYR
jgi:hypothetical protein